MSKPLATLRRQFAAQGWHLLFSFDASIAPGTIVHVPRPRDVNHQGSIFKYPAAAETKVAGPADVGLLDFSRTHELSLGAAAELLALGSGPAAARRKRVKTVKLSLDRPVKHYIADKIELFSRLAVDPGWPSSAQARQLGLRKHYLVTETVRTRIRYTFHGAGELALDASAAGLGDLKSLGLDARYAWDDEHTLAARKPLVVAYEAVAWDGKKRVFRTLKV